MSKDSQRFRWTTWHKRGRTNHSLGKQGQWGTRDEPKTQQKNTNGHWTDSYHRRTSVNPAQDVIYINYDSLLPTFIYPLFYSLHQPSDEVWRKNVMYARRIEPHNHTVSECEADPSPLSFSLAPATPSASQATERWNPRLTAALRWQHLFEMVTHLKV